MKKILFFIIPILFFSNSIFSQYLQKEKKAKAKNYTFLTGSLGSSFDNNGIQLAEKSSYYGLGWEAGIGSTLFDNRITYSFSLAGERFLNYFNPQKETIRLTKFRTLTTSIKFNAINHKISGLLDGTGGGIETGLAFIEKDRISNITGGFLQLNLNLFWIGNFREGIFIRGTYHSLFFDFDNVGNLKSNPGINVNVGTNMFLMNKEQQNQTTQSKRKNKKNKKEKTKKVKKNNK
ncbi:hypothetical protein A2995_01690 [Candidatus Nomurabacteria bacterium RIFCSPLOWO2_01_FULL_33_24]|uniref:Uncharacterized protein n=1 Tax=Candidatus Nomurabacteria bacterium RIFCSPLOWO2_01_FULL_33_24 TaxID=1801765 RepID=A0A1F6X1P2_9BACT|nr:MAG: hypothetical protein A2995_01690 [Candidatus Nomurabacteria bacterium RIFCSPLOWO2_01_FULL_33_24]